MVFVAGTAIAQQVQWASEVLEASTELSPTEYSAEQALGKPNVPDGGGESPNAWIPYDSKKEQYIKVAFESPLRIRQIAIAESFNPGAIYQVYMYDRADNEFLVNTFEPGPIGLTTRMQYVFLDLTEFEVAAVKIVLHPWEVPGLNAIDAIGISNSALPLKKEILIVESNIVTAVPERLSENVNSVYNELRPLISPDGNTLYFSRQYHPGNTGGVNDPEDIWYTEKDSTGEWKEAQNIGAPLNNPGPNFISSITPDGSSVVLTLGNEYKGDRMVAGVSYTNKTSQGWTEPKPFKIKGMINESPQANFFLANNRKVLILSIQDANSRGSRDLYVSFLEGDGSWSEPMNLGDDVNSVLEEASPFLAPDDKTLYFSSNGRAGFGKHDIYVTRRLDDSWTSWTEPENLGPNINSSADDRFFNIPATGEYGYFSRDVAENNSDIFRFELPKEHQPEPVVTIRGVVYDTKTRKPIGAHIFYETLPQGEEVGIATSDPVTGAYQIILPTGTLYGYLAESDGYLSVNANIDLKDTEEYGEVRKDLYLTPIEKGASIRLNNVFFDFDKYVLKEESHPELNRTIKFLLDNPEERILVSGHTDNIGNTEYNQNLSQKRAEAVVQYLVEGGISQDRLIARGYGESRPVVSNDDEVDGRELNRRVEMKILEEDAVE
jgi:outer membrane protein OmpA-like peptidoglycan-associated protein